MKLQVYETVFAFTLVVLICLLLRKLSIIKEEDGNVFAKLLTQAVLPAVIFLQLSATPIRAGQFLMVLSIFVVGVLSLILAWLTGRILRLSRAKIGALMLTSSFGSSALLGYPFIAFSFPDNPEAIADAVLLSELGVGLPLFIVGPAIAIHFGASPEDGNDRKKALSWTYFRSPIFVAVALGILVSLIPVNRENTFIVPFFEALKMINGALAILACLILSLQLKLRSFKGLIPIFIISAIIQMWFQPFAAHLQAGWYNLSVIQTQVLVVVSSMPSAVLGPVFASRHNCAPDTASALVISHIVFSVVMIPVVFYFLG